MTMKAERHPDRVVVVGAHPDDPETGCGGTMLRYAAAGAEVVAVYLTRGEAGVAGLSSKEAAKVRTAEAEAACQLLGARARFASQVDGATRIDAEAYEELAAILDGERPSVLFTHWPIDTHRDHRVATALVLDAWHATPPNDRPPLYYYEVMAGEQTQSFTPTDWVDITEHAAAKRDACFRHASQKLETWYDASHGQMERFRGQQASVAAAEAFVRHTPGPTGGLP